MAYQYYPSMSHEELCQLAAHGNVKKIKGKYPKNFKYDLEGNTIENNTVGKGIDCVASHRHIWFQSDAFWLGVYNPLSLAVADGKIETVKLLIEDYGASVHIRVGRAKDYSILDCVELWRSANPKDKQELIGYLLTKGAYYVKYDNPETRAAKASYDRERDQAVLADRERLKELLLTGEPCDRSKLFQHDYTSIPFSPLSVLFIQAKQHNNSLAQAQLGYHYWLGIGLPKDMELARYWYTQSSRQGNVAATAWLAVHPA